jgi:hypothetical protein
MRLTFVATRQLLRQQLSKCGAGHSGRWILGRPSSEWFREIRPGLSGDDIIGRGLKLSWKGWPREALLRDIHCVAPLSRRLRHLVL